MIWTEDENSFRAIDTMQEPKGKSCKNCQWGDANVKPEDRTDWTTCGHHHQNFKVTSLCAYWTNPNDPRLKLYHKKRKEELREKLKAQKIVG